MKCLARLFAEATNKKCAALCFNLEAIDNDALKRLKLLEKLSKEDKAHIYALMDAFFAKSKLKTLMD